MDALPADATEDLAERLSAAMRIAGRGATATLVEALRGSGALAWPMPRAMGGYGIGLEPAAAASCVSVLLRCGMLSMPMGRLLEGHINALRLIARYGTEAQLAHAAAEAPHHLFAIWAAEDPHARVRVADGRLSGVKTFASGAGHVTRALVTAQDGGEILALVSVPPGDGRVGARVRLHGMQAAATAQIDLTGLPVADSDRIGQPGDYMAQPEIALGAWRTLAVIAGGVAALTEAFRADLLARGRSASPNQRARFGAALTWSATARLWAERAGLDAERLGDAEAAATVGLAREAIGWAVPAVIALVQRSAGLAAMRDGHPIEALCRDLSTYVRQPALDETLDEAVAHHLTHPVALAG